MSERPFLVGFGKFHNEIIRSGNIYRCFENLGRVVDAMVACDDGSVDGTREYLQARVPADRLVLVPPAERDFDDELRWKQAMIEIVNRLEPAWVYWVDGDEVLDRTGTAALRDFLKAVPPSVGAVRIHYSQFWRNTSWARTDSGFDDGFFWKCWRWTGPMHYAVARGLHRHQFPEEVLAAINQGRVATAPFEQLHYGNVGKNLVWKTVQYRDNPVSVQRHLHFDAATYRPVDQGVLPEGAESVPGGLPAPFTPEEKARILALQGLRGVPGLYIVVTSAYNRADTLHRALSSLLEQTYENWVSVVVDDGSFDGTPDLMRAMQELDPRFFYVRFPDNCGGVAANEVGMALACEMGEYWTRLGSDDWFHPEKLAHDVEALRAHHVCYGLYTVWRNGQSAETCNLPEPYPQMRAKLLGQAIGMPVFVGSWANVGVRTSALRALRERHGNFCDPRLRNMEDFLVMARLARANEFVWRGKLDGGRFVVADGAEVAALAAGAQNPWGQAGRHVAPEVAQSDAFWNVNPAGASSDNRQTAVDDALTRQIILEENARG